MANTISIVNITRVQDVVSFVFREQRFHLYVSSNYSCQFDRSTEYCQGWLPVMAISLTSAHLGVDVDRDVS